MLALTKKTDYALVALWQLSRREGSVQSAREIATSSGIPQPMVTNVLKHLAQAGIVTSARGASGGYGLARPVEHISLHEVVEIIEGPMHLVRCMPGPEEGDDGSCELAGRCPIRLPAQRVHHRFKHFLESVSLKELFREEQSVALQAPPRSCAPVRKANVEEFVP